MKIEMEVPNITFIQDIIDFKIKSVERAQNQSADERIKQAHVSVAADLRKVRNSINQLELLDKRKV